MMKYIYAVLTVATTISALSQAAPYAISPDSIHQHIAVLAADSLEGRQVGEPGEWKAAQYIASVMRGAGLEPMGDDGSYFQSFDFVKAIDFGPSNRLTLNGVSLALKSEFLPLRQSASVSFSFDEVVAVDYGITIAEDEGDYDDYDGKDVSGKAVLIKRFAPSAEDNPHVDFDKYTSLTEKIRGALEHKAAAVIFITPSDKDDTLLGMRPTNVNPKDIPIVFLRRAALEKLGLEVDKPQLASISGEVDLVKTRDTAQNVIGALSSKSDTVMIMGAHYDHLGWGASGSLYAGNEPAIHNGADDNASGTASMLELARFYSSRRDELKYSLVFVAFTGEEAGLLGSSHFVRSEAVDSSRIRMMVNMDMVGRLADHEEGLAVFGTGTCLEFKSYFDSLKHDDLKIVFREPGTGPSDHTPFYNRGVPVLHLFTGAHKDYHKPSDDVETIDFKGTAAVASFVSEVITHFDKYDGSLTFQKTKDPNAGKRRSQFSVSLGVMPDYIAEVKGLKIDGVTPARPAERAGIIEGDIVVRLGNLDIGDIYDYMNALGKFRKGDSITVVVLRGDKTLELPLVFE
ncbi:MAG: M28 family peptidase [Candidatus Zixiibacteriota bacterium]